MHISNSSRPIRACHGSRLRFAWIPIQAHRSHFRSTRSIRSTSSLPARTSVRAPIVTSGRRARALLQLHAARRLSVPIEQSRRAVGRARGILHRRSTTRERRRASLDQSHARRLRRQGDAQADCCSTGPISARVSRSRACACSSSSIAHSRWRRPTATGSCAGIASARPVFALAQWGNSYAFLSLLPQAPLPATIVGVRTDSAVVHAGDAVRVVGFARTRIARRVAREQR